MRKTLKKNLAYDDKKKLFYISFYAEENGRRVRRTRTFTTMQQAEAAQAQLRASPGGVQTELTLGEWLRYWLEELAAPGCEKTTLHGYESIVYAHLIPALGTVRVRELSAACVQQYYGQLRRKGLGNNTIRKHHVLLHTALEAAVRQGRAESNVTRLVTPPAREKPEHRYYDPAQLARLFRASEGDALEVVFKLAGYLGLRRSEICGLKWRNVDLDAGVLTVREVRTAVGGQALEKAPKSCASERKLSFCGNGDLEALLARLRDEWERRRAGRADWNAEGYVVATENGRPCQPDVLCQRIAQFISARGLPPISLHGLRHSFASVANSRNAPLLSISRALGHSSTSVTSTVYLHLFDDAVSDVVALVSDAVALAQEA